MILLLVTSNSYFLLYVSVFPSSSFVYPLNRVHFFPARGCLSALDAVGMKTVCECVCVCMYRVYVYSMCDCMSEGPGRQLVEGFFFFFPPALGSPQSSCDWCAPVADRAEATARGPTEADVYLWSESSSVRGPWSSNILIHTNTTPSQFFFSPQAGPSILSHFLPIWVHWDRSVLLMISTVNLRHETYLCSSRRCSPQHKA